MQPLNKGSWQGVKYQTVRQRISWLTLSPWHKSSRDMTTWNQAPSWVRKKEKNSNERASFNLLYLWNKAIFLTCTWFCHSKLPVAHSYTLLFMDRRCNYIPEGAQTQLLRYNAKIATGTEVNITSGLNRTLLLMLKRNTQTFRGLFAFYTSGAVGHIWERAGSSSFKQAHCCIATAEPFKRPTVGGWRTEQAQWKREELDPCTRCYTCHSSLGQSPSPFLLHFQSFSCITLSSVIPWAVSSVSTLSR